MYSIRFDAQSRILELRLEDFWSSATLARFAAELLVRATALRVRHGGFAILSDSSRFPVQSPEVAQGFERLMARGTKSHTGPTAIVVASVLNKMQAERSLKAPRVRVFLDADEAKQWLQAEWSAAQARRSRHAN